VDTPFFMPVATQLSVKALDPLQLKGTGTSVIITNGFLSHLSPGSDVIAKSGGVHRFMGWDGGIFSDSGGFQFIRKGFGSKVSDEGVSLRSPYSGERVFVTPESVIDMHMAHGVDVGMVLDHCPPFPTSAEGIAKSAARTVEWARRSMERLDVIRNEGDAGRTLPLVFGITQGGTDIAIRASCSRSLVELGLDGYGIGGLSIGESKEDTFHSLDASTEMLPVDAPRYFMGVGEPEDIIRSVRSGVDIFDSVFPTRNARHRSLFTGTSRENVRSAGWKGDSGPIMEGCDCMTCTRFSRGYLYHLFKAREPLAATLASIHNIRYIQRLMGAIRTSIREGQFEDGADLASLLGMM